MPLQYVRDETDAGASGADCRGPRPDRGRWCRRTVCEAQVRETLGLVEDTGDVPIYADPGKSGLGADWPVLHRLLIKTLRGGLRRVVVRALARLARSATLLETILGELCAAGVEVMIAGRTDWRA